MEVREALELPLGEFQGGLGSRAKARVLVPPRARARAADY